MIFDHHVVGSTTFDPWGKRWRAAKLVGYLANQPMIERNYCPDPLPTKLNVEVDTSVLQVGKQDTTRVTVCACDQAGNRIPFLRDDMVVTLEGESVSLIGPPRIPLRGGYAAFWLRVQTDGKTKITITSSRFKAITKDISIVP